MLDTNTSKSLGDMNFKVQSRQLNVRWMNARYRCVPKISFCSRYRCVPKIALPEVRKKLLRTRFAQDIVLYLKSSRRRGKKNLIVK